MNFILFDKKITTDKRLDISLQKCFGLGKNKSLFIFSKMGFNLNRNKKLNLNNYVLFNELISIIISQLISKIFRFKVESFLLNYLYFIKKDILKSKTYKALRHFQNLPVRGQRSKNNAHTQKKRNKKIKRLPVAAKKK